MGLRVGHKAILSFYSLLIGAGAMAQTSELKLCSSDEYTRMLFSDELQFNQINTAYYSQIQQWSATPPAGQTENGTYIVPVVFHILHNYGIENISDNQIIDAVRIINEDFQKLNADTSAVVNEFKALIGNANVEFRLAQKDPNGNCTNGINRIYTYSTYLGDRTSKATQWPRNRYLNVWVVDAIESGAAGYALLPAFANFAPSDDGIVILNDYVGSIGTGNSVRARALTHEIGHYLGLLHVWGNTNNPGVSCGDDGVDDTPITRGFTNCSSLTPRVCNASIVENIQNQMDYSYCSRMFTIGQANVMQSNLDNDAARRNLWQPANLTFTGTNDGFSNPCAPRADFAVVRQLGCAGSIFSITDFSWNGTPTSWNWTVSNGTTTLTSTTENPSFTINDPGVYDITLTVTNAQGSNTLTKQGALFVSAPNTSVANWSYYDEFNDNPLTNERWIAYYSPDVSHTWEQTTAASTSAPNALRVANFGGQTFKAHDLVSPSYDFTSLTQPAKLYFKYAYARRNADSKDYLEVYLSTNCGNTWILRKTFETAELVTSANTNSNFVPTAASQWKTGIVDNLNFYASRTDVRFRFRFISGGGNNFYIDDVNITGQLSDEPQASQNGIQVYPNPAVDAALVQFNLPQKDEVFFSIHDLSGRLLWQSPSQIFESGQHQYTVQSVSSLSSGVYVISMHTSTTRYTHKLIKQ